ncbi:MAG: hypothetical protein QOC92_4418 [Acidimicrobiaceae bacterium]
MKKLIATVSIITALGGGAFALNSVLPAGATSNVLTQADTQGADPSSDCPAPRAKFKGVLDKLVANGTITQEQEDAIIQAFKDAKDSNGGPGKGRGGPRMKVLEGLAEAAAAKIGVTVDELKAAVQSGQSVADLATAHGVAPADVESAIVEAATAKIDQAVKDGKLTQTMADKLKAHVPDAAHRFVTHIKPEGC